MEIDTAATPAKLAKARSSRIELRSEGRVRQRATKLQIANTCPRKAIEECSRIKKVMEADKCRLRAILTAIDELGFELSRRGKVIGTWAGENTQAFRPPEFVVGKSIGAYFGEKALRDMRPVMARVMESGNSEDMIHIQNLAGSQKWYKSRFVPIKTPIGRMQSMCLFSRDITERKSLEGRLGHAEKMEAIGHLVGGISHDFNNILGVIQGTGELLSINLGAAHPQHKYVAQLLRSTESAAILTQQLLAFSRQQVREPKITNLNDIVTDVEQLVHRLIAEDIELRTVSDPHLYCVTVDSNEIQRVIMNLVNNARDAMPNGGTILIQTANAFLCEEQLRTHPNAVPGKYVVLTVKDTGVGMEPATLSRIFKPFFTTKKNGRGTGLGLASVCAIVNQSGGFISASSHLGKGTCFHIYFPAASGQSVVPTLASLPAICASGSETVLLVEDSRELRSLLKEMLETAGLTVIEASTAEEALHLACLHFKPVDLLITDIVMRGLGGHELAHQLKKIYPKLEVLYMTGYTRGSLVARGDTTPLRDILSKPFTRNILLQRVAATLRRAKSPVESTRIEAH
jgi:two-component system cell cycle sensor histidine kinase/response regulator CckA